MDPEKKLFPELISLFFAWLNSRLSIDVHPLKPAPTSRNAISLSATHLTGKSSQNLLAFSLTATNCASTRCQAEAVFVLTFSCVSYVQCAYVCTREAGGPH